MPTAVLIFPPFQESGRFLTSFPKSVRRFIFSIVCYNSNVVYIDELIAMELMFDNNISLSLSLSIYIK